MLQASSKKEPKKQSRQAEGSQDRKGQLQLQLSQPSQSASPPSSKQRSIRGFLQVRPPQPPATHGNADSAGSSLPATATASPPPHQQHAGYGSRPAISGKMGA